MRQPPLPWPPPASGLFRTRDAVSDAHDSAEAIRNLAAGEYNNANADYSADYAAWQAAEATWNQRKAAIQLDSQANYDAALAARNAAYTKLGLESASVTLAFGRLGEADNKIAQGDMTPMNQQQLKIQYYNQGEAKAGESRNASAAAGQHHTGVGTDLAAWNAILAQYP